MFIVIDYFSGGELFERLSSVGSFTETEAADAFKQMICAVNYCYCKKICHKDLKPENFLYSTKSADSALKLIDFGLSQIFSDPSKKSIGKHSIFIFG